MGNARLNVWVRDTSCNVVDRPAHLHVTNCHGVDVITPFWFRGGHTEVELPPGCYMVTAGVVWGNIYTDKTMVVAKCDQVTCVNLVLTKFSARNPPDIKEQFIALYCPLLLAVPTVVHGLNKGMDIKEIQRGLAVIAKAADIDPEDMMAHVKKEAEWLRKNMKELCEEDRKTLEKLMEAV